MDIRYSVNQRDFKRYTTEEIRDEFLIRHLFEADQVSAVYSHVDRMVTLGLHAGEGNGFDRQGHRLLEKLWYGVFSAAPGNRNLQYRRTGRHHCRWRRVQNGA